MAFSILINVRLFLWKTKFQFYSPALKLGHGHDVFFPKLKIKIFATKVLITISEKNLDNLPNVMLLLNGFQRYKQSFHRPSLKFDSCVSLIVFQPCNKFKGLLSKAFEATRVYIEVQEDTERAGLGPSLQWVLCRIFID